VWDALVRSPVGFNRVPEKVLEKVSGKVPGGFGAESGQQSRVRVYRICGHLIHRNPASVFGFAARFRQICKNKMLRLLGIPPKLIGILSFRHTSVDPAFFKFLRRFCRIPAILQDCGGNSTKLEFGLRQKNCRKSF
jgi:hypothetical protein